MQIALYLSFLCIYYKIDRFIGEIDIIFDTSKCEDLLQI